MVYRALLRLLSAFLVLVACMALGWATASPLASIRDGVARFDDVAGLAAAVACWTLLGWVALVLALTALGSIPGALGRLGAEAATRLTPVAMSRATRLALGLTVVAGPATVALPVNAAPIATRVTTLDGPAANSEVLSLPDVGRPGWNEAAKTTEVNAEPAPTGSTRREVATVVVEAGDCLWTIAAEALAATIGSEPSNAAVAAEWPRWYAVNRAGIGADPDLLLPGMLLRAPAPQ
jgi:resuscitation-promoting factor RpfA